LIWRENETFTHRRRWSHRLEQTLDTAEPAARWAGHLAAASQKLGGMRCLQPDPQLDADIVLDDLYAVDCVARLGNTLGKAESDGKVLKILRRCIITA
jgi:hypothetical protein